MSKPFYYSVRKMLLEKKFPVSDRRRHLNVTIHEIRERERFVLAVFLAFCVFMIFFYEVYVNERENFNDKKMKRKSLDKKRIKFVIK